MSRVRFLLRPRWLLSHLLVAVLAVTMVNLGFWQLRRLDERRAHNDMIERRWDEPAAPVGELLAPGYDAAVDGTRFRKVTATGQYAPDDTVVVRNRSQGGAPGGWIVTPLVLATGDRVGVIRGFVGFADDGSIPEPGLPADPVTVEGLMMDPDRLGGTAAQDLADLMASEDILPGLVQAETSDPTEPAAAAGGTVAAAGEGALVPVPPPELSEGPHLSYAAQWFIFSTIAVLGYPVILRRVVLRRGKEVDDSAPPPDGSNARGSRGGSGGDDDLDREIEGLLREGA